MQIKVFRVAAGNTNTVSPGCGLSPANSILAFIVAKHAKDDVMPLHHGQMTDPQILVTVTTLRPQVAKIRKARQGDGLAVRKHRSLGRRMHMHMDDGTLIGPRHLGLKHATEGGKHDCQPDAFTIAPERHRWVSFVFERGFW